jgi:hypothetical protein
MVWLATYSTDKVLVVFAPLALGLPWIFMRNVGGFAILSIQLVVLLDSQAQLEVSIDFIICNIFLTIFLFLKIFSCTIFLTIPQVLDYSSIFFPYVFLFHLF